MPTKLKGMTSLEIAIIVAIVLVIAVAVSWYLYSVFAAQTTGKAQIGVPTATYYREDGYLVLFVVNQGPGDVDITAVEMGKYSASKVPAFTIKAGQSCYVVFQINNAKNEPVGVTLQGRVITKQG